MLQTLSKVSVDEAMLSASGRSSQAPIWVLTLDPAGGLPIFIPLIAHPWKNPAGTVVVIGYECEINNLFQFAVLA